MDQSEEYSIRIKAQNVEKEQKFVYDDLRDSDDDDDEYIDLKCD